MHLSLVRHVDAPCAAVSAIVADVTRTAKGGVVVQYNVKGWINELALAKAGPPERSHHLWRHSCFEVFARVPGDVGYQEFNFAPSSQWAAYGFTSRRSGMHDLDFPTAPRIQTTIGSDEFTLTATLDQLNLPIALPWQIGLSVIIEEAAGALSFWALAHPSGSADFHHDDCFAFTLPALDTHS